jgi:CRP-like cAMP-binding protein
MTHWADFSSSALISGSCSGWSIRINPEKQLERLLKSALFDGLTVQECGEIFLYARQKTFVRDEALFCQGQSVDKWILIQTGKVKLTQVSAEGNEVIVWMNGSGDVLGVQADAPGAHHTCSGRAVERSETLVWGRQGVQTVVDHYPQVKENIARILVARLAELEERFREIASEGVANRLALALLRFGESRLGRSNRSVELRLKRQDIAQMTGTTLCTVSRVFSKWARMGLVVPHRQGVTVPDTGLLLAAARTESGSTPRYA